MNGAKRDPADKRILDLLDRQFLTLLALPGHATSYMRSLRCTLQVCTVFFQFGGNVFRSFSESFFQEKVKSLREFPQLVVR